MILKWLKLHNIRSYTNAAIEFPEGTLMLAGDVGAGKSTILMAIEFALFGLLRGILDGSHLLRHGKSQGSVELCFMLGTTEVIVKRALKKVNSDVRQDSGHLIIDGRKQEYTASELKARLFELLGYPKDLVTKSKYLIFRYTVYTPQEEMNAILSADSEFRLDTLRRIFKVDKYKRIRENTVVINRDIREKIRELQGRIADYAEKSEAAKLLETQYKSAMKQHEELSRQAQKAGKALKEQQAKLAETEKQMLGYTEAMSKTASLDSSLKEIISSRTELKQEESELQQGIAKLTEKIGLMKLPAVKSDVHELEAELHNAELKFRELSDAAGKIRSELSLVRANIDSSNKQMGEIRASQAMLNEKQELLEKTGTGKTAELERQLETLMKGHEELLKDISVEESQGRQARQRLEQLRQANVCPLCLTELDKTHKHNITSDAEKTIQRCEARLQALSRKKEKLADKAQEMKLLIQQGRKSELKAAELGAQINELKSRINSRPALEKELVRLAKMEQSLLARDKEFREQKLVSQEKLIAELKSVLQQARKAELEALDKANLELMLKDRKSRYDAVLQRLQRLKQEIGKINKEKILLSQDIRKFGDIGSSLEKEKQRLAALQIEEKELSVRKAESAKEEESVSGQLKSILEELSRKELYRKQISSHLHLSNWMSELFSKLLETMERHVMVRIHQEFNDVFQQWFALLMEQENLSVRLGEDFGPVVEQNGYESDISSLSGGERTSCALAYNLALNKVINDVITSIHTKDLLILDEPTDGFSSEQLDKVRDVLNELAVKQVILVSHEDKVESFVQHVLRVVKHEHASEVH
ncbi:SMC family ATPase [Candidatus Woesearchaeota archaeon]|nr:SMC family ATPase [Candidatus Woesearchaeota archaeon]